MTSVLSWQNCQPLTCFILYSKVKLVYYSRQLLSSYFYIPVPYNEKDIFFQVFVLEGLVGLHRTIQLSFFSITGQDIDLDYHGIEWFALEMNRDHSVVFEIASKYYIQDSFVDNDGYSISSKDSCPQQQIYWSSELNSPIQVHFSQLIPKMSMFTLARPCLTTSNLP